MNRFSRLAGCLSLCALAGCGVFWGFDDNAEGIIAEKCVLSTDLPEVQAGIVAATDGAGVDSPVYVCRDDFFDHSREQPLNAYCTVGWHYYIFIRQLAPQYVCQCAYHEAAHVFTGNLYGAVDNAEMSATCSGFSLELPEPHSYLAD